MSLTKKLIFALPFLLLYSYFLFLASPILNATDIVLSLSLDTLFQIIIFVTILLLSSFFFVLFCTFSQDWKFVGPVLLIASLLPLLLLPSEVNWIFAVGTLFNLALTFVLLESKLRTYLTFQPIVLLNPSMKSMTFTMLIVVSIASFFIMQSSIRANGIKLPASFSQTILQMTLSSVSPADYESPLLTPEACAVFKKNPQLLLDNGVPKDQLELIDPENCKLSKPKMEERLEKQALAMLDPYIAYFPYFFAFMLFISLTSFSAIIGIFLPFLVWITFSLLKSAKFTKFTTEMREVKKLVV